MAKGKLYIVPTPIGNLDDMTFRAVQVLKSVDRILAEDTRHTRILCDRYEIHTPLSCLNDHNAVKRLPGIMQELEKGATLGLVSDAGTPGISDPGLPLIQAVVDNDFLLEVLPGASAVVTALSGSGFSLDRFVFEGFLPRKGKDRKTRLAHIALERCSVVFYESPKRLVATLRDLQHIGCGGRSIVVARELTKLFETWHRGSVDSLEKWFEENPPRGEIVIVLKGVIEEPSSPKKAWRLLEQSLSDGLSVRQSARLVAEMTGLSGSNLYKMALAQNRGDVFETFLQAQKPSRALPL